MDTSALKILNHLDRINAWMGHGSADPINVQISPYNGPCNHHCPMCTSGHTGFTGESLSLETYESLIADLHAMGVKSITLSGGSEPTLHPDFDRLLYAKGPALGLITNGSRITPERARLMLQRLSWVRVSLDAASAGQFQRSHGAEPEEFTSVLQGIETLVSERERTGSKTTIGIGHLTHPSGVWADDIVPAARLAVALGVDYLQFRPLLKVPGRREIHDIADCSQREVVAAIREAQKFSTPKTKIVASFSKYDQLATGKIKRYKECGFVQFAPAVCASGNVSLCCHHLENPEFIIGNLKDAPLSELWWDNKQERIKTLSFERCPLLCRGSGYNEVLEACTKPSIHPQFI